MAEPELERAQSALPPGWEWEHHDIQRIDGGISKRDILLGPDGIRSRAVISDSGAIGYRIQVAGSEDKWSETLDEAKRTAEQLATSKYSAPNIVQPSQSLAMEANTEYREREVGYRY